MSTLPQRAYDPKLSELIAPSIAPAVERVLDELHTRQRLQIAHLVGELCRVTQSDDPDAALKYVEEHKNKKWFHEGFQRGLRLLLDTFDSLAEECARLMVVDYLHRLEVPDRIYRQFAQLFQSTDQKTLELLLYVSDEICQMPGIDEAIVTPKTEHEEPKRLSYDIIGRSEHRTTCVRPLWKINDPSLLEDACAILVRTGFLSSWSGHFAPDHPEHRKYAMLTPWGRAVNHQLKLWGRLNKYLDPVRVRLEQSNG